MIPVGPFGEELVVIRRINVILDCATNSEWLQDNMDKYPEETTQGFADWEIIG